MAGFITVTLCDPPVFIPPLELMFCCNQEVFWWYLADREAFAG